MNGEKGHNLQIEKVLSYSYPHLSRHAVHKRPISKKTAFYIHEYGPHSHIVHVIMKESMRVLLLASVISSLGGLALENIRSSFLAVGALVVLLPMMNNMIGNYGVIISSRFSTLLHEGRVGADFWKSAEVRMMLLQVMVIAAITSLLAAVFAVAFTGPFDIALFAKIALVSIAGVGIIVLLLFFVAIIAGLHFYKKKEDPNNFLIPITTSIADFGNMLLLSALVVLFF
ncbi:MAG TPA: hypothetical protein HA254_00325 [Candidatus Diapherotrites archaeon]|uniref:SLC41A/MgtE integral membrane domain-containing protein n=1 Tax=Candidatus Iainarchaeum sp. TaxID=3101447 RepID=A0A7J4J1J6_9ARCH|nr:hypothetical protein [Candidatus Diapherotrites archaeon]